MNPTLPVILYTGLSAFVESYAKKDHAFPVVSLFGAKGAAQAIAAALVCRKEKVCLFRGGRSQEVWLTPGEHRIFGKTLPCGAHHILVIHASGLLRQCALSSFILINRLGNEAQLRSVYFSFLDRLVPIPLLPGWTPWLWTRGVEKKEIHSLEGFRLTAHECRVDAEGLKRDLSRAIKEKILCLEENRDEVGSQSESGILPHAPFGR